MGWIVGATLLTTRYIPYHPDIATSLMTCRDSAPNDKCKMTMMGNKLASDGKHTRDEVL